MAFDRTLQLSDRQDLSGTGVVYSTDHITLAALVEGTVGSAADLGEGNPLWAHFHIDESFAGGTFLRCELVVCSTALGDTTDVVIASTGDIPITHPILGIPGPLVAGESHMAALVRVDRGAKMPVLPGLVQFPASYGFVGFRYIRTGTFTLGRVTARITDVAPAIGMKIYPVGIPGNSTPGIN